MDNDYARLAAAVARYRKRYPNYTHDRIRELGGPSGPTVTAIERGESVKGFTLRRLERGLEWPEGFANKVLANKAAVEELFEDQPLGIEAGGVKTLGEPGEFHKLVGKPITEIPTPLLVNAWHEITAEMERRNYVQERLFARLASPEVQPIIQEYQREAGGGIVFVPIRAIAGEDEELTSLFIGNMTWGLGTPSGVINLVDAPEDQARQMNRVAQPRPVEDPDNNVTELQAEPYVVDEAARPETGQPNPGDVSDDS